LISDREYRKSRPNRFGWIVMIVQYIEAALSHARYEIIDDEEPYYGEVPELAGVWATGKTLEECRRNLAEIIDGWIVVRLRRGFALPSMRI
jgi:predicted RNase H-like HicB family nuclease